MSIFQEYKKDKKLLDLYKMFWYYIVIQKDKTNYN